MPVSRNAEFYKRPVEERMRHAGPAEAWAEYQAVLEYLRFNGRGLQPTARLILLTIIGHEAPTAQVQLETGACSYAVNRGLSELTKRGLLIRDCFRLGRFKHYFYRINKSLLESSSSPLTRHPQVDVLAKLANDDPAR